MVFEPGKSGCPGGRAVGKPLTDALLARLAHTSTAPEKPRTVAQAIVEKLISNALAGDQKAIDMIFDRVEGKAAQHITASVQHEVMDVVEAARRIAFAINSARMKGEVIDGTLAALAGDDAPDITDLRPEEPPAIPYAPVDLPPVAVPKGLKLGAQLTELTKQEKAKLKDAIEHGKK